MSDIRKIHTVFFSATGTTYRSVCSIAEGSGVSDVVNHDITQGAKAEVFVAKDEMAIFAAPVYAGRIPIGMEESLNKFHGEGTPAMIACVYGNRAYDDALLELRNIVETNGFVVVGAGAFVAQHSIFPKLAAGRPDDRDRAVAEEFGRKCVEAVRDDFEEMKMRAMRVPGNYPYKEHKALPLIPSPNRKCDNCGVCARMCPRQAINLDDVRDVDASLCMSCARCIYVCPNDARHFSGIMYAMASRRFVRNFSARKESEVFYR